VPVQRRLQREPVREREAAAFLPELSGERREWVLPGSRHWPRLARPNRAQLPWTRVALISPLQECRRTIGCNPREATSSTTRNGAQREFAELFPAGNRMETSRSLRRFLSRPAQPVGQDSSNTRRSRLPCPSSSARPKASRPPPLSPSCGVPSGSTGLWGRFLPSIRCMMGIREHIAEPAARPFLDWCARSTARISLPGRRLPSD
jgi:hypothetical protein